MKKFITLSSLAFAAMVFSQAEAQQPSVSPQPMLAPAMKQQNTQQNSSTATPSSAAPVAAPAPVKADKKAEAAPPVYNKIAVSDPGVPSDKPSSSAKSAAAPSNTKKGQKNTAVSPK